ncbi:MAG: type I restriction-modification system subunit M N-terminal domain-containing protein, partial [Acidimicrobiia bacterium]
MSDPQTLVRKLWSYCDVLRDDGLSYGDYVEQLTYLLFLKMADEQTKPPFNLRSIIPAGLDWQSLKAKDGDDLEVHYRHLLTELGKETGMLGVVFRKAQNRIQDPA